MKSLASFLCLLLLFFSAAACFCKGQSIVPFTFARITDIHVGNSGKNVPEGQAELDLINNMNPSPSFVIATGDLVEEGTAKQYKAYQQLFSGLHYPLYNCPGNHDVRWAPLGKESLPAALHEPLYRSFDKNGCHFVLLDSTVLLEHWGHFEASELAWLKKDLDKTGRETPVFIFFHHWLGRTSNMVDNEDEFFDLIKPYNVKIVFCGHGHQNLTWRVNGVQYVMTGALYDGAFDYTTVTSDTISLYRMRKANNQRPELLATIPLAVSPAVSVHAEIDHEPVTQIRAWSTPSGAQFSWRVDNTGAWNTFPAAPAADPTQPSTCPIDLASLTPGVHDLVVRASYPLTGERKEEAHDGQESATDNWITVLPLEVPSAEPLVQWHTKLGGTVQSRLLFDNGTVYVACFDGKVYALDSRTGKQKWSFATGGAVYASPTVFDELLYVASTDHNVYAINSRSGKLVWKTALGGPIFASVNVGAGVACVGTGDKKIYGLDAKGGRQLWSFQAQGFVQSEAAYADNTFFVGAWDNTFYALRSSNGSLKWSDHVGSSMFYSPSIAQPAVRGQQVFAVSNDDTLHAFDEATGHQDWIAHGAIAKNKFGYSAPLFVGSKIFIGTLGDVGAVECLDATTGKNIWTSQTGSVIYDSSCAYGNGRIYIGAVSGDFRCLDAQSGKVIWTYHLPTGHLLATAAVDGDTAYIASMNGIVYALKTAGMKPEK